MIIWFSFFFLFSLNDWIRKWFFWVRSVRQKLIKKIFHCFLIFLRYSISLNTTFRLFSSPFVLCISQNHGIVCVCVCVLYESAVACTNFNHSSLLQWFFNSTNQININTNVIKNGNWYVLLRHFNCELSFISYFPHRLTIDFQFRHNHISNVPLFYWNYQAEQMSNQM